MYRLSLSLAGLPNPYMVLMDFNVATVQSHASQLGFDAISTYALPGGTTEVNAPTAKYFYNRPPPLGNSIC